MTTTKVLFTVDTELSAGRQANGLPVEDNFTCSIIGATSAGDFGVHWQMDQMEAYGIFGVFFIDPMPALIFGPDIVKKIVDPILRRGHEVQLHIHTEWLKWAKNSPVGGRTGQNIGDFSLDDQIALIGWAKEALISAGAPSPNAFRAGNFGANDDTLRALAQLGLSWDSSFNADYAGRTCGISVSPATVDPVLCETIYEMPVAGLWDRPGHFRPAQICAVSAWEMEQALHHAAATQAHSFALVTHSFEMLSRDRKRPNRLVMKRFVQACRAVANDPRLAASGFHELAPPRAPYRDLPRLAPHRLRTGWRMAEQAMAGLLYERK